MLLRGRHPGIVAASSGAAPPAALAFDAATNIPNTKSALHTAAAGADLFLVFFGDDISNSRIAGATWAGNALALAIEQSIPSFHRTDAAILWAKGLATGQQTAAFTSTLDGGEQAGVVATFAGAGDRTLFGTAGDGQTSGLNTASGTIAGVPAGALVVSAYVLGVSFGTLTPPASATLIAQNDAAPIAVAYEITGASGDVTHTWTSTNASRTALAMAAFA